MLRKDASVVNLAGRFFPAISQGRRFLDCQALTIFVGLMVFAHLLSAGEPPTAPDPTAVPAYAASPLANTLFTQASADFNRGHFDRAATKFQLFLDRYPTTH